MKSAENRYHNDPKFKSLIDLLVHYIRDLDFTPTEIREASMFASIIHEQNRCQMTYTIPYSELMEKNLQMINDVTNQILRRRNESTQDN